MIIGRFGSLARYVKYHYRPQIQGALNPAQYDIQDSHSARVADNRQLSNSRTGVPMSLLEPYRSSLRVNYRPTGNLVALEDTPPCVTIRLRSPDLALLGTWKLT
jgi:hypothetical protein